jgi:hypothetical protein
MEVNNICSRRWANIIPANVEEDIVKYLLRQTAEPLALGPGEWHQGGNNMGNNVTPQDPPSIITEGGEEDIKLQPFIAPVNHNALT